MRRKPHPASRPQQKASRRRPRTSGARPQRKPWAPVVERPDQTSVVEQFADALTMLRRRKKAMIDAQGAYQDARHQLDNLFSRHGSRPPQEPSNLSLRVPMLRATCVAWAHVADSADPPR